jgi:hypothetical protein
MRLEDVIQLVAEHGAARHVKQAGVLLPLTVGALLPGAAHKAMERASAAEQALQQSADRSNVMGKMGAAPSWEDMPESMRGEPSMPGSQAAGNVPTNLQDLMAALGQRMGGFGGAVSSGAQRAGKAMGSAGMRAGKAVGGELGGGFMGSLGQLAGSPLGGVAGGINELIKRKIVGRQFGEQKDPFHIGASKAVESFGGEVGKAGAGLLADIANKAMDAVGHAGDEAARQAILGNLKRTDSVLSQADDATLMESYNTMKRFAPVLSTDKNAVRSFLRQAVMSGSGPDFVSIKMLSDAERSVTGEKKV